jgi:hypothetical protein
MLIEITEQEKQTLLELLIKTDHTALYNTLLLAKETIWQRPDEVEEIYDDCEWFVMPNSGTSLEDVTAASYWPEGKFFDPYEEHKDRIYLADVAYIALKEKPYAMLPSRLPWDQENFKNERPTQRTGQ